MKIIFDEFERDGEFGEIIKIAKNDINKHFKNIN